MKVFEKLELMGFFEWLKEKGFNVGFTAMILDNQPIDSIERTGYNAIVFRWFREKYDLDGEATRYNLSHSVAKILGVDFKQTKYVYVPIINGEDFSELENMVYFLLKEEAELACLEKLIEIVESKTE